MSEIDRFANPEAFALLALAPIAFWMLMRRWRARSITLATPALQPGVALPVSWRVRARIAPALLRAAAIALAAVALARPQHIAGETQASTEGIAIQILADRSSSMREPMLANGRQVPRFTVAQDTVRKFVMGDKEAGLPGRPGDMIGLITFAQYADTVCPLVRSHEFLADLTDELRTAEPNTSEDGTAIGEAIARGAARLKNAEQEIARASADEERPEYTIKGKAIILMTDGLNTAGEIDPLAAARLAKEWGIRIYTIGIGNDQRSRRSGLLDLRRQQMERMSQQLLAEIASLTGGQHFNATSAEAMAEIYARINELETTEIKVTEHTSVDELFAPFAAATLFLLLSEAVLSLLFFRGLP